MPRKARWVVLAAALSASAFLLARRAGPSRESLVPLLRAGQEHGRQLERLAAKGLPVGADEEIRLGREMLRWLPENGPRQGRVEALGRRIERTGLAPRFAGRAAYRTLPGPEVQAFAAPGGVIVLSEGLLDRLEDDPDRIAFVIGHELAHVELGHTADLVRYKSWLQRWGLPGAGLAQGARALAALSFSESQELEADRLSLELLKAADLRPEASIEALDRIDAGGPRPERVRRSPAAILEEALGDYWRTHPGGRERRDRLTSAIGRELAPATSRSAPGTDAAHGLDGAGAAEEENEGFFLGRSTGTPVGP